MLFQQRLVEHFNRGRRVTQLSPKRDADWLLRSRSACFSRSPITSTRGITTTVWANSSGTAQRHEMKAKVRETTLRRTAEVEPYLLISFHLIIAILLR